MTRGRTIAVVILAALAAIAVGPSGLAGQGAGRLGVGPNPAPGAVKPALVFAYYYIWYEPQSWDRAKTDVPQLGPY